MQKTMAMKKPGQQRGKVSQEGMHGDHAVLMP
jgi:hypothetical protein